MDYCRQYGVGKPHYNLRILASRKNGASSAPMLSRTWGLAGFTSNSKAGTFLSKANGINLGANLIWIILKFALPDVIIKAHKNNGTDGVFSTTFHELGHASHFKKVGSRYWIKYINYIITYGTFNKVKVPYGDGHGKNAGTCALGEAWANYFGYTLTLKEFGANNRIISPSGFENFDPVKRPNNNSINPIRGGWEGWIPAGIMLDITDSNRDLVRTGYYDNVSGYSTKNIFDALDSGVESPQAFRDRLLRENSNRDSNDIKELFKAYYWE
ncbi:MAG: hypothetical protein COA50_09925 [Flavobacteriaceae bacterium]|nr:MAG: hypothetical protein COA50_09925 [Flavobacteriaceae bacterium]